jgi:hypothetical protein
MAKTRSQAVRKCPEYRLVADVVNAAKHGSLTRPSSEGPPLVAVATDITEITVITRYEDDQGAYSDVRTRVDIQCTDGVTRSLDEALTAVVNYWGGELKKNGVLDYIPRPGPVAPGSRFVPRAEARLEHNMEAVQGLRWKQSFQLLHFNPALGRAEPVDLTGANLEFRLYRPRYTAAVTVEVPGEKEPLSIELEMGDEDAQAYHALKKEEEQQAFMKAFFEARQDEVGARVSEELASRRDGAGGEGRS